MHKTILILFQALCLVVSLPASAEEIDEIFVTAVRRAVDTDQLSIAVDTVGGEDVRNNRLLTNALASATGVMVQQTTPGQGAAIVRGQKGSAVLHLVDGMRVNNAIFRSAPTQYFALVPTLAVERVEILRGTPASLYGSDAIGGVIQVVTRTPEFASGAPGVSGELLLSANTAEEARVLGGLVDYAAQNFASSFSAEFANVGDRRVGGGATIEPSGYDSRAVRWLVASRLDEDRQLSLDLQFYEQPKTPRSDELVPGFGQDEPSSSEFFFRPNRRAFVHGEYRSEDGPLGLDWAADLAWQRIDDDRQSRDYLAPERTLEANRSDLFGLTVNASRLTETGSWIVVIDLYHDDVASRRVTEDLASGQRTEAIARFPDGSSMQLLSGYANGTWSAAARHAVTAGVRLSDVRTRVTGTQIHNTELSGDLGWVLTINDRWRLMSNLGYGFRAPNVFDVGTLGNRPGNRFNIPNTGLESEHVVHGDIGIRYESTGTRVEVTAFAMRYRDRIISIATGNTTPEGRDITQSVNAAASTVRGVEASASFEVGERWGVFANLAWTWGEQEVSGQGREPADRIPPLNGYVAIDYDAGGNWQAEAWASFAAAQSRLSNRDVRDSRIDPQGTPGWAGLGARISWQPADPWTLVLELSNALDAGYRVHGSGIDAVGRNVTASVRRRF